MGASTEMGTYSGEYVCMHVHICVQIIMFKSVTFQECNQLIMRTHVHCMREASRLCNQLSTCMARAMEGDDMCSIRVS